MPTLPSTDGARLRHYMINVDHLGDMHQLRGEKFPYSVKSRLRRLAARVLAALRAAPPR